MITSEWAARNPRAVLASLESAARSTWREMQRNRRELRKNLVSGPWQRAYATQRAAQEAETLRTLLSIRGGHE